LIVPSLGYPPPGYHFSTPHWELRLALLIFKRASFGPFLFAHRSSKKLRLALPLFARCRQRLSSAGRAMVHPPRAAAPVPCRPPTCLLVEDHGGGPAPMELLHLSPHAAKRSRPQAVGAWRAWRPLLAAFPPLSTPTRRMAPRSLFRAWLQGMAALNRFFIAWFQGPVAWPPIHLKHAASGSGGVLCCFGRVSVHDERADPCTEQLAARLYRACGPDAALKSVTRVIFKPTWSSFPLQIRRC
jgi:hypothetical protein